MFLESLMLTLHGTILFVVHLSVIQIAMDNVVFQNRSTRKNSDVVQQWVVGITVHSVGTISAFITMKKLYLSEYLKNTIRFNEAESQEDRARIMGDKLKERLEKTKAKKKMLADEFSELGMVQSLLKIRF